MPIILPVLSDQMKPMRGAYMDWTHPSARGLVGFWLMNEGAGGQVWDVARQHTGTITSAVWSPSARGIGLNFAGGNYYVNAPDAADLDGFSECTIEAFIRYSTSTPGWATIFAKKHTSNADPYSLWSLQLYQSDHKARFEISTGIAGSQVSINGSTVMANGGYYHLMATYDHSYVRLYVNGVLDATPVSSSITIGANSEPVRIGNNSQNASQYFEGLVVYARLWNRALLDPEVRARYADPYAMLVTPSRQWWMIQATEAGGAAVKNMMLMGVG